MRGNGLSSVLTRCWRPVVERLVSPSRTDAAAAAATRPTARMESLEGRVMFSAGDLDLSFGNAGRTDHAEGSADWLAVGPRAARQADGRLVAVDEGYGAVGLTRYNADGTVDLTFGAAGRSVVSLPESFAASALAVTGDGKVVVVGTTRGTGAQPQDFGAARFNADGTLDTTFGQGGVVTIDFGGADEAADVAVTPDGKLLIVGSSVEDVVGIAVRGFHVARLNADGSLDATFGQGGKVSTRFADGGGRAAAVVVTTDGHFVVAGQHLTIGADGPMFSVALARYDAAGALDAGFGAGGLVLGGGLGAFESADVRVQADGKVIAAGTRDGDLALARFRADGTPDAAFGAGGLAVADFGGVEQAFGLALGAGNAVVVAGRSGGAAVLARFDAGPLDGPPAPQPEPQPAPRPPPVDEGGEDDAGPDAPAEDDGGGLDEAVNTTVSAVWAGKTLVKSGKSYLFKVTYASGAGVDVGSIGSDDIVVSGPNDFVAAAVGSKVKASKDGSQATVLYRVNAPGGAFDAGDNGRYTLTLESGAVLDAFATGGTGEAQLGGFTVSSRSRPTSAAVRKSAAVKRASARPGLASQLFSDVPVAA